MRLTSPSFAAGIFALFFPAGRRFFIIPRVFLPSYDSADEHRYADSGILPGGGIIFRRSRESSLKQDSSAGL